MLAKCGFGFIGIEPAQSSLEMARTKPFADQVRWILGDSSSLPPFEVDPAVMSGNVVQVFVSEDDWIR